MRLSTVLLYVFSAIGVCLITTANAKADDDDTIPLTGAWTQSVAFDKGVPFDALVTFTADGNLAETDQPDAVTHSSPGHGVWRKTSATMYAFKVIKFVFDPAGNPVGRSISRGTLRMTIDGNAYCSSGVNEIVDLNGKLLDSENFSTKGTRIRTDD